jgi:hypothetical protein
MPPRRTYPRPVARSRIGPGLLALHLACGRNPAFDDLSPDPTAAVTSTGEPPATPDDPTTGAPVTSTSSATTGGLVDPTTDTSATTGTTTGTTGAMTTTDVTTGFIEPEIPEKLQFYETQNCGTPLWCHEPDQPPSAGKPQRTASQLCFRPDTDPPYLLDRIGWVVAQTLGDLENGTFLEVYSGNELGPDQKLWELALGAGGVTVEPHAFVFKDDPLVILTPIFCVGLVGGYTGDGGAGLGLGVDPFQQAADRSYINFSGGGSCDMPGWIDVDVLKPEPTGTWCIDVELRGN